MTPVEIVDALAVLHENRLKHGFENDSVMLRIVQNLSEAGVYPKPKIIRRAPSLMTEIEMVVAYGAYWHIYSEPHSCPHCKVDLCNREHGPPFSGEIFWKESRWSRVTIVMCPDCKGNVYDSGSDSSPKDDPGTVLGSTPVDTADDGSGQLQSSALP